VDVLVEVGDGTTHEAEFDRVDAGVARAFDAAVGTMGHHEVVVTGAD